MTLDQLQQRLSQLAQELHDTRLHYLREALDPYAPPGSKMLVIYTEHSDKTKPLQVEWVVTASAGVQAGKTLEIFHPEAMNLLTTLLQTPELGEAPDKTEETLLLNLNVVTSGAPRDERKIWTARTYQFPGERQVPQPRPTPSRRNSTQRKVTPAPPAPVMSPEKAEVQTAPTPAPQVQEEVKPSVEAPTLPAPTSENAKRQEEGQSPSPEAKAQVGDIWTGLSAISRKPAYFFKVMAVSGDTYHCQRCKSSGELKDESTAFTLSATKLSGTHRLFQLHGRE